MAARYTPRMIWLSTVFPSDIYPWLNIIAAAICVKVYALLLVNELSQRNKQWHFRVKGHACSANDRVLWQSARIVKVFFSCLRANRLRWQLHESYF